MLFRSIVVPKIKEGVQTVWHQYAICCRDKDAIGDFLAGKGIGSAAFYPVPLHLQKAFDYLGYKEGEFPVAESVTKQTVCLPIFPELTKEELENYEVNTGRLIVEYFQQLDIEAVPCALCKNHGPFAWGKDAKEAVHNAVVLEEVAKMAARCEMLNPQVAAAPQELQDKHYFRKHGANAYYGQ